MIQAIAISDLHLGEDNSALRPKDNGNELLDGLLGQWRELAGGKRIEELLILGDLMDLSLAYYSEAIPASKFFFQKVAEAGLFEKIIFLPGNHDHHVWHHIVEQQFVFRKLNGKLVSNYPRTKAMLTEDRDDEDDPNAFIKSSFLNQLLPPDADLKRIYVTYPHYLLKTRKPGKAVLCTHGHFFEKEWTIITDLLANIIGGITIDDLETFNAPLTEFLWYNLGQSERLSLVVEQLYKHAESGSFDYIDQTIHEVMLAIDAMDGKLDDGYIKDHIEKFVETALRKILHLYLRRGSKSGGGSKLRNMELGEILGKIQVHFKNYLEPRLANLEFSEYDLIFGHTHAPGQDRMRIAQKDIGVFNTGGWLADEQGRVPGAAFVVVADDGGVELKYCRES